MTRLLTGILNEIFHAYWMDLVYWICRVIKRTSSKLMKWPTRYATCMYAEWLHTPPSANPMNVGKSHKYLDPSSVNSIRLSLQPIVIQVNVGTNRHKLYAVSTYPRARSTAHQVVFKPAVVFLTPWLSIISDLSVNLSTLILAKTAEGLTEVQSFLPIFFMITLLSHYRFIFQLTNQKCLIYHYVHFCPYSEKSTVQPWIVGTYDRFGYHLTKLLFAPLWTLHELKLVLTGT